MQHCPNCGAGELKIIAAIVARPVIEKILKHRRASADLDSQGGLSEPASAPAPPKAPAREPVLHHTD